MKQSKNSTDHTIATTTKCPFEIVIVELCDEEEVLNNCREQHTWCVALYLIPKNKMEQKYKKQKRKE